MVTGALLTLTNGVKTYRRGAEAVHALRAVSVALHPGEVVGLAGPSGSGKSTLLNTLCGWETPDEGTLDFGGGLTGADPAALAWSRLALVPQTLGLLEDLSIEENITMPARIAGNIGEKRRQAQELMELFRIDQLARRRPHQVSLGEQQRCCVARALVLSPDIVLADEPTAHQDSDFTDILFDRMRQLARAGSTFLVATHNPDTWHHCDRVLSMSDGELRPGAPEVIR
ncbi:MAG TPA: ATP-binding cassette domain-containing protein [Mycobacteriales bacterium]|jgi:putative ABC transport system ATP-binding protein|nr:ATP-binding cassette domain-containing protein [Mycobacteriales bacterium]